GRGQRVAPAARPPARPPSCRLPVRAAPGDTPRCKSHPPPPLRSNAASVRREAGPQLVEQSPGRLIVPDTRIALELTGRDALLRARHEEEAEEPDAQRNPRAVEDRAGRHRTLIAAAAAWLEPSHGEGVTTVPSAPRTTKALRPS